MPSGPTCPTGARPAEAPGTGLAWTSMPRFPDRGHDGAARPVAPRRDWRVVVLASLVLVVLAAGALLAARGDRVETAAVVVPAPPSGPDTSLIGAWPTTTTTTTTTTTPTTTTTTTTTTAPAPAAVEDGLALASPLPRPWATSWLVADARVPSVPLHQAPGVPVPSGRAMASPTAEGLDLVFLVRGRRPGWLLAQLMSRPNSAMAWIRESDVTLRRVPNHIVIERGARRLTVYHGEEVLARYPVATGKASSPTPIGTFFVDARVRLSGHRAYGDGQVSFTGFSEVYASFGGGQGQVAMHGTQNPALIGTPASHGCVRLTNEGIRRVLDLAEAGTPVEVVP